jgi:microcystin-dependent protein
LASGYGDTQNPYASKTANYFLSAPNGSAGVPTFRAIVAADIPTLNQNTTGTAANVTGTVAVANGGTGATTAAGALTNLGAYAATNPNGYTSNTGTVTSVAASAGTGISITGSPVTTSGTLTITNTGVTSVAAGTGISVSASTGGVTITNTGSQVPTGAVEAFAMSTAPSGWLACNGAAISRTTYATLFAAIGTTFGTGDGVTTFNVPDVRGYFVRGWDNGRGVDSARTFGSNQAFAMQQHRHLHGTDGNGGSGYNGNGYADSLGNTATSGNQSGAAGYAHNTTTAMMPTTAGGTAVNGAAETRPVNIAMLYCIKF